MQTPSLERAFMYGRTRVESVRGLPAAPASLVALLINLDGSTDRLARMRTEFDRAGVDFERIPAVNGMDLPASVRSYFCDASDNIVSPLRSGEIGCYASHLVIWQRIASGCHGPAVLVCEDDIAVPADLRGLVGELLRETPAGWDLIRLSSDTRRPVAAVATLGAGRSLVRYWGAPLLSGAYLISRHGA